jgi:succinate-semialdehyde dehydrogenase/glutarate-semialdehyde dehydrogenase
LTCEEENIMSVTDEQISRVLTAVPKGLLIGGKWISTENTIGVEDPSTGKILASVADASPAQGIEALDAAVAAADEWAATDPRARGEILRKAFELLTERAEDIALLMTLEMGKPLAEARGEVTYGAEFFRWFSEEAVRIAGRYSVAPSGGTRLLTMKQPVGPVYAITPWNFPLAMGTRKIGPALAAGCTVVIKPAAQTPLTTLALAAILIEAGLPDGVVNVITTSSSGKVSAPIIADPRLKKLTFTGSTPVGQRLIEQSAQNVLKVSMELGGNAPFLVFPDADLDKAVDGAMLAKMRNIGEACTAANRFIVHESVAAEFSRRLAERMGAMTIGRGITDGVTVGPLVDAAAVDKVTELVADAVSKGATVITGGTAIDGPGHFYPPTVLTDVPTTANVFREEIFGPVAPVITFTTDQDGIDKANDTEYGLIAYAFTENLTRALTVAEKLQTGMVGINQGIVSNPAAPFGGVKASGLGREGGTEGIDEYLETKYVGIKL